MGKEESLYRVGVTMYEKDCIEKVKLEIKSNGKVKIIEHTYKRFLDYTFKGNYFIKILFIITLFSLLIPVAKEVKGSLGLT